MENDFNIKPTFKNPTTDMGKNFEDKFSDSMRKDNVSNEYLKEVDSVLNEKEESLKKKIFQLDQMEGLVFGDTQLSAIYNKMAEDGGEKYGYHYNETIMNLIFNEYVMNSPKYLQKYKMAIPVEKKRRDKSGIHQLQQAGAGQVDKGRQDIKKKLETPHFNAEGVIHNNSLPGVMDEDDENFGGNFGITSGAGGFDINRDGVNRTEKSYNTMEEPIKEATENEFLSIETHIGGEDDKIILSVVNQNIDSHLEGFTKSKFDTKKDKRILNFHTSELPILIRRLEEMGTERTETWARDIQDQIDNPGIEETTGAASGGAFAPALGMQRREIGESEEEEEVIDETTTSASSGAFVGPFSTNRDKKLDKPAWNGGEIIGESNYLTESGGFKQFINEMEMSDTAVPTMAESQSSDEMRNKFYHEALTQLGLGSAQYDSDLSPEERQKVNQYVSDKMKQQPSSGTIGSYSDGAPDKMGEEVEINSSPDIGVADEENPYDAPEMNVGKQIDTTNNDKYSNNYDMDESQINEYSGGGIVQYDSERNGENPFDMNGDKYQFVNAIYPDGKRDIGVYKFGEDMVYDYTWWRQQMRLDPVEESIIDQEPFGDRDQTSMKMKSDASGMSGSPTMGGIDSIGGMGALGEGEDNLQINEHLKEILTLIQKMGYFDTTNFNMEHYTETYKEMMNWYSNTERMSGSVDANIRGHLNEMLTLIQKMGYYDATNFNMEHFSETYKEMMNWYGITKGMLGEGEISEDVATRTKCNDDEEPVPEIAINQSGGCKKKYNRQDADDAKNNPHNLAARRKRMAKKEHDLEAKKGEYQKELTQNKQHMENSKAKNNVTEDKKPSSLINVERLGKKNDANFKADAKNSNTQDVMDMENEMTFKDQIEQVSDNPYELAEKLEKQHLDITDGEALKNKGNSTNDSGDEITKRNMSTDEEKEKDLITQTQADWTFDNEPSEEYERRMKKDMGDDIYELRKKKQEYRADAPMYNKDTQPTEEGEEKDQFDKMASNWNRRDGVDSNKRSRVGESMISGKYKDVFNNNCFLNFKLNETVEATEGVGAKINLDGMGNSYTTRVHENNDMRDIMDSFDFYMNDDKKVSRVKKGKQNLSEGATTKVIVNEDLDKMKQLMGYDPAKHSSTANVKKNRRF